MLSISINKAVSAKFLNMMKNAPSKSKKATGIALRRCGDELRNDAVKNAPYKTGNLRRSITMEPGLPTSHVTVGSNLVYARIHDVGGDIEAKSAKYLTFKVNGQWVKVKKVHIRPTRGVGYLTPAFEKLLHGRVDKIFMEEITNVLQ